ncbi:hypothetical protein GYH30_024038 [Glycine max]|nr:hypothetical protein GYH30_024038 [Glycine max]
MVSFALLSWADLTSKSITALGIGVSDPPPALCLFARFLSVFFFIFCLLISEALKVVSEKQVQLLDWILIPLRSNQSFFSNLQYQILQCHSSEFEFFSDLSGPLSLQHFNFFDIFVKSV